MSKEDAMVSEDARCLAHGAPLGAPEEVAPDGLIGDAMSYMSMSIVGRAMLGSLFATTLVRPPSSGQGTR